MQIINNRRRVDRAILTFDSKTAQKSSTAIRSAETKAKSAELNPDDYNSWHKVMRFIRSYARATRRAVIDDQYSAFYYNALLAPSISPLAYNTKKYLTLSAAFDAGTKYPIADSHVQYSAQDGCTVFYAPQDADYLFGYYTRFEYNSSETVGTILIEQLIAEYDTENKVWLADVTINCAVNVASASGRSIVSLNTPHLIRVKRGARIKFGLRHVGSSATWASIDNAEARVFITKAKSHATLYHS